MYLISLSQVKIIVNQLQLPPNLMLLPPSIENVAKAMASTSTPIDHQRSLQLLNCDYVDDEVQ